jgi:ABC-type sugar transport system ATPase subunit
MGLSIDPASSLGSHSLAVQQLVAICRATVGDCKVLILDEPTSSLTEDEVHELFAAVRELARSGVGVLFVSHRLVEVFELSTELTVMRDGRTVDTGPVARFTRQTLVDKMVGGVDLKGRPVRQPASPTRDGTAAVELRSLRSPGAFEDISLRLRPGKIVGVAGLVGSGRSELLEAMFGVRPVSGGAMLVHGGEVTNPSPRSSIAAGIGYLPPDRKTQGLVLSMSVSDNVTMVATHTKSRLVPPNRRKERSVARRLADSVNLRAASLSQPVRTLSGGNQQKVGFCKWIASGPRVLLLDDPTRGVDVSAKAEIHTQLRQAAADGLALLVTSSEIPELIDLCDEVLVMYRGTISHRFNREQLTEAHVATAAAGGEL